jgi:iron complex outermembrane receptor protein
MLFNRKPIALAVTFALSAAWQNAGAQSTAKEAHVLNEVVISASKITETPIPSTVDKGGLETMRPATSDTASLLRDIPGISLQGAGGVSSLPAIHGLADDRVRVKVDGMDLISSCANHMNSPLSYIDPTNVGSVKVFAGITPVSAGGDSIAGTIIVNSAPPVFAKAGEGPLFKGEAGAFYRSNGDAHGGNVSATVANENLSITYSGSTAKADNYDAGKHFKAGAISTGTLKRVWISGAEVGSSLYETANQSLGIALRHENHLLELKLGHQNMPYQGFPNQRMDLTDNTSQQVNLRYTGQYAWGNLEARIYNEDTRHTMNFLDDKRTSALGMPMDTKGKTTGALIKADVVLSENDILRVGSEYQRYRLDDWWDPVTTTVGMMGPNVFWNINDGQRDRFDVFGEWEARWSSQWTSQLGVRSSIMSSDAGRVQGYNNAGGMMGYGDPGNPATAPGAFNTADHSKTDHNIDLTALLRFTPDEHKTFEAGIARKTRSPNLYERYTWSTNNNMAMNMVNWFGDGNGYVGNLSLKPEIANTISATASWHDPSKKQWELSVTPYYTYVQDYIDAVPCATVGKTCPTRTDGWVNRSFDNQSARLYGADISGFFPLAKTSGFGNFTVSGMLNYVDGKNRKTGDNLYNIMPLNAKLALVQRWGNWTNTVEGQFVGGKNEVSSTRNELETGGYSLLNLRSSYEWKQYRFDVGVENLFDRYYQLPLGGTYLGQKPMTYGTPVPGMGRSLYTGLNIKF